jgi:hypothetical protein
MSAPVVLFAENGDFLGIIDRKTGEAVHWEGSYQDEPHVFTYPWIGKKCSHCGALGNDFKVCGRCQNASYCSMKCHKLHQGEHSKVCVDIVEQMQALEKVMSDYAVGLGGRGGGGGAAFHGGFHGGGARTPHLFGPGRTGAGGRAAFGGGGLHPGYRIGYGPGNWRFYFAPAIWALWGPYYYQWYPSRYWYIPDNYAYPYETQQGLQASSLPALEKFPANATPKQIEQDLLRLRADPAVAAIENSNRGFLVVPDAFTHEFVWINTKGPVGT